MIEPCKFKNDETRELIAAQMAEFEAAGKSVEHFGYLVKSTAIQGDVEQHRRPDGTLSGKVNSKLFDS